MAHPKCECGVYAIGECVECDTPVCMDHGTKHGDRLLCAKHLRQAERVAKRAERERQALERQQHAEARLRQLLQRTAAQDDGRSAARWREVLQVWVRRRELGPPPRYSAGALRAQVLGSLREAGSPPSWNAAWSAAILRHARCLDPTITQQRLEDLDAWPLDPSLRDLDWNLLRRALVGADLSMQSEVLAAYMWVDERRTEEMAQQGWPLLSERDRAVQELIGDLLRITPIKWMTIRPGDPGQGLALVGVGTTAIRVAGRDQGGWEIEIGSRRVSGRSRQVTTEELRARAMGQMSKEKPDAQALADIADSYQRFDSLDCEEAGLEDEPDLHAWIDWANLAPWRRQIVEQITR